MDLSTLGTIGNIAQGLGGAYSGYSDSQDRALKQKQAQDEAAYKKQMMDIQMANDGLIRSETGGLILTPEKTKEKAVEAQLKGYQAGKDASESHTKYGQDVSVDEQGLIKMSPVAGWVSPEEREARRAANKKEPVKIIPAGETAALGSADASIESLKDLQKFTAENSNEFGPARGLMNRGAAYFGVGKSGENARVIDSYLKQRAQVIGKYLEGGKLTDQDILRYQQQLPTQGYSPEVINAKISSLQRQIEQKKKGELASFQKAGYDTSQFSDITPVDLKKLQRSASAGLIPDAQAAAPQAADPAKLALAQKALSSTSATPAQKANAQKYLQMHGVQ